MANSIAYDIKEISIITEVSHLTRIKPVSVEFVSHKNPFFTLEGYVNTIAAPKCKSQCMLFNALSEAGEPLLIKVSPKNLTASQVFPELQADLRRSLTAALASGEGFKARDDAYKNFTEIEWEPSAFEGDWVTWDNASPSFVLPTPVPGAFAIKTKLGSIYLYRPNESGKFKIEKDTLVLPCSVTDLSSPAEVPMYFNERNVDFVRYVSGQQLDFIRKTGFFQMIKCGMSEMDIYSQGYEAQYTALSHQANMSRSVMNNNRLQFVDCPADLMPNERQHNFGDVDFSRNAMAGPSYNQHAYRRG